MNWDTGFTIKDRSLIVFVQLCKLSSGQKLGYALHDAASGRSYTLGRLVEVLGFECTLRNSNHDRLLWQIGPIISGPNLRVAIFLLELKNPDCHLWSRPWASDHGQRAPGISPPYSGNSGDHTANSIAHGRRTSAR